MTTTQEPIDAADRRAREVVSAAYKRWEDRNCLPEPLTYVVGELRAALADAYREIEVLKAQKASNR